MTIDIPVVSYKHAKSLLKNFHHCSNVFLCTRIGVCLSPMHHTAGGSLHGLVHNSNNSSAVFRREAKQQGAAGRAGSEVLTLLRRSCDFLDNTQTPVSALITTSSRHLRQCRLCFAFLLGDICFLFSFFDFCVCRLLEVSWTPPHSLTVNPAGDLFLSSHKDAWISSEFLLEGQAEELQSEFGARLKAASGPFPGQYCCSQEAFRGEAISTNNKSQFSPLHQHRWRYHRHDTRAEVGNIQPLGQTTRPCHRTCKTIHKVTKIKDGSWADGSAHSPTDCHLSGSWK